jgi:hypothetical protein
MRITHHAVGSHADFIDVSILAKNVTTLDQFIKNMMSEGKKIAKKIFDTEEDQERYYNQFVGDLFEVFVEFFIKSHGRDRRIGISNYNPVHVENGEEDLGVDGHGIGTNGRPATVQVKFRAQHDYMLTTNADSLSNFKNASHEMFNVNFDDIDNMLVVTTAKSVHHKSRDRMLNGKVRFLFRHDIEKLVNNNIAFWNAFHAAIMPPVSIKQQVKQLEAV